MSTPDASTSSLPSESQCLPTVYIVRHGETTWSLTGRHTGLTDILLTHRGEREALLIGERLKGLRFPHVFTSPLQRAARTCELAGFAAAAKADADLVEWNYGDYEGRRTDDIHLERPGWQLFRDGCPGGESVAAIGVRADRVISRLRAIHGEILVFSHAHFGRVLTARWLGLDPSAGRLFVFDTGAISVLGYEHNLAEPAIHVWNDRDHIRD
jgi:broad specificity phosphatase PhoE